MLEEAKGKGPWNAGGHNKPSRMPSLDPDEIYQESNLWLVLA